jgi:cytidyltransferase-like protein
MSGINHLYDIYNKKGQEFIEQLFNTFVTVNEKMDGSAFTFERDKETGKFKFYRRDQRNPITFVDRTLMKYYEKPIQYIESLPPHILEKIPRGWRFGLEYFANNKPVEIMYDSIPKNHLLLSYVHEYGDDGKIKKTIQDKKELDDWADLLGIDRAPIIFQGYLTDEQKSKITEFLRTPFDQLVERFKTQSFVRFIIGTLNPDLKKTALNEDLDKDVEGIVFRFGDPNKDSEPVLAKMVDPVFTQMAKDKSMKQKENKPSDFLGLTLMDVMNFILEKGLDTFKVEGDSEDERYVSFMGDVFSKFLEEYYDKYKGADFEEPEYLKRDEFRLNKDLIDDRRVLKYVNEDDSFESLFKLMLNSFRKIKSRAGGIITKGMMEQMNLLIRDIKDYIQKPRKGRINEGFMSFLDFKKEMAPEVDYLKEEDEETEADENPFYSYKEFISALETIDSTPKLKSIVITEKEDEDKKLKDVNLLVGRFQPFHNGHLKMAKFLKEKNDLPSVAVVVYPGHNKSGKSPFNEDLIKKYMDGIVGSEKEVIDYIIVQRGLIGSAIVKLLEKGYKPNLIGAGEDRMDDYTKQLDYVKKSDIGDQMQDLKLIQTPRATSATEVRNAIKDEDYQKFRKLVPSGVEKMYTALKSAIEGKMQESFDLDEESDLIIEGEIFEGVTPDISLDGIRKDIEDLQQYLKALAERGSITDDEKKKLSSVSDAVNRIKNLTKGHSADEEKLKALVADLVFGGSGDKKSKGRKVHKIDNLFHDLSGSTVDNLIARYISDVDIKPISLEDIKNNLNGILDINLLTGLNGISGKDIKKIYNFDSSVGSGLQQRGKGETLFSLAFNAIKNDAAGGDVMSRDTNKVIEIKSSNNAGITPKYSPSTPTSLAPGVDKIITTAGDLFDLSELKNKRMQKTSSESLISKIEEGGEGVSEFLKMVEELSGIKNPQSKDILPIILLLQLDYYSKKIEEFQTFAIFIEKEDAPDKIVILDSEIIPPSQEGTFVTPDNINALIESKIAPKVTSSDRVEIYMFNKKIKN